MKNIQWWKTSTAYQIYPKSFCDSNGDGIGDLQGIIQKLDYLVDLGIDLIWLCPMYQSPFDDNGYDISDYQAIADVFGTMADFDALLAACHQRGMKLIIDLVVNHTSDEHPWFIESRSTTTSEKRDWYIWRDGIGGQEPNNWESIFGNSTWEFDEETGQYFFHCFSKRQPDLNWEHQPVREAVYEMMNWWLAKGIDGFRIDAISHLKKVDYHDLPNPDNVPYVSSFAKHMNQPGLLKWLHEMKNATLAHYDCVSVGEASGVNSTQALDWVDENDGVFNMIFQFEHLHLWEKSGEKTPIDVKALKTTLSRWQTGLANRGWNALFIENHDKARSVSTWGDDTTYWRESATSLATMYFLMQGTPFIFQGQELGMTNIQLPSIDAYDDVSDKIMYANERANGVSHEEIMQRIWLHSRDNSRTPMQWDDSEYAGFSTVPTWLAVNPNAKTINVATQLQDPDSILNYYKQLIALRKNNPVFIEGTYRLICKAHPQIYAYTRTLGKTKAVIITNLTAQVADYRWERLKLSSDQCVLHNYPLQAHTATSTITLQPYEARVYIIK